MVELQYITSKAITFCWFVVKSLQLGILKDEMQGQNNPNINYCNRWWYDAMNDYYELCLNVMITQILHLHNSW